MKFGDLLHDYFKACQPLKKPRTQETEWSCEKHLVAYFGQKLVKKITGKDVIDYRNSRPVGPRRIMRELSVASAACNWAISDLGLDIHNPFAGRLISKRDRQGLEPPRKRSLSASEVSSIVMAGNVTLRHIVLFAVNTGMRQTEILELTWNRIQDDLIYLTPKDQKSNAHGWRALNEVALGVIAERPKRSLFVFDFKGEPISRMQLHRWWTAACQRGGVTNAHFHDLRRTCGSILLDTGASMEDVKTQLGHADIRTTQNNYASDSIDRARAAVARMNSERLPDCTDLSERFRIT